MLEGERPNSGHDGTDRSFKCFDVEDQWNSIGVKRYPCVRREEQRSGLLTRYLSLATLLKHLQVRQLLPPKWLSQVCDLAKGILGGGGRSIDTLRKDKTF